jgi:hypothetical protein
MRQYPAAQLIATPEPAQAKPVKLQARPPIQADLL